MEKPPKPPETIADTIRPLWKAALDRQKKLHSLARFMDAYATKADELVHKYPDAKHRRAYHALIGSTMMPGEPGIIEEDFPGDDSVVQFLSNLANEE